MICIPPTNVYNTIGFYSNIIHTRGGDLVVLERVEWLRLSRSAPFREGSSMREHDLRLNRGLSSRRSLRNTLHRECCPTLIRCSLFDSCFCDSRITRHMSVRTSVFWGDVTLIFLFLYRSNPSPSEYDSLRLTRRFC